MDGSEDGQKRGGNLPLPIHAPPSYSNISTRRRARGARGSEMWTISHVRHTHINSFFRLVYSLRLFPEIWTEFRLKHNTRDIRSLPLRFHYNTYILCIKYHIYYVGIGHYNMQPWVGGPGVCRTYQTDITDNNYCRMHY